MRKKCTKSNYNEFKNVCKRQKLDCRKNEKGRGGIRIGFL